jgi:hypothetical protein
MERKFRLQLEEDAPLMIADVYVKYLSDEVDVHRKPIVHGLYMPRIELPNPPPPVIRMTLQWTDNKPEDRTKRVP